MLETHEERLNSQQQQINTGSTVAVDSHGYVTRGEGTGERITVQEGLVRTQEMATENRAAVSRNRQVGERNSRAIASQARTLRSVTVMFPGMWVSTGSSEPGSESPGRAAFCMRS
ncbi:hypothetical protein ACKKEJ_004895 [Escherichia coli]